jgi:hypothetical protein
MNDNQTVFTVFYAIFWGSVANVQPRWKAFQLPLVFDLKFARRRAFLSVVIFNLFPLAFYAWILSLLNQSGGIDKSWSFYDFARFISRCVVPAFAAFGFYRLWLSIVEMCPKYFYSSTQRELPPQYQRISEDGIAVEPSLDELSINPDSNNGWKNLIWAFVYFGFALSFPCWFR